MKFIRVLKAGNHLEQLKDLSDFSGELIQVLEKLRNSLMFIEKDDKYVDFDSLLPELIESTKNTKALASTFLSDIKIVSNKYENINKKASEPALNYEDIRKNLRDENNGREMFFAELVKQNGDILWNLNKPLPKEYNDLETEKPFDYSERYGGTVDSFKYYNNYIVLLKGNK